MKKRVLAWTLCFALAFSLVPATAQAAEDTAAWAKAYREYIQQDLQDTANNSETEGLKRDAVYFLFDVNGDSIPELWIDYIYTYAGKRLCTYSNGDVVVQHISSGSISYLPKENLVLASGGRMDVYYDVVYRIENGFFTQVARGDYFTNFEESEKFGDLVFDYTWNGMPISGDDYQENLCSIFDMTQAVSLPYDSPESQTYQEILQTLEETTISPQTYHVIDVFSDYDPNTQQVTLAVESKEFPHRKYYVSEETDSSFINRMEELKGQPVAVRYKYSDYDTMYLLSVDPVEKVFGHLASVSDTEVTIDGNTYPVSYAFNTDFFPEAYEGKYVLCYVQDGAAISMENMEQGGGTLESWSSATGKAKINGKEYTTSALSDLPDHMNQLVGKYVFFTARPLDGDSDALMKVTFQPGIYISSNAATTNSLTIGESMDLYVNYYRADGSEAPDLKGFYALPSDESVVTVSSDGWHEEYGQHFVVSAKKLGTTTISFGMTEPEARSLTMGLTVVPEKAVYRFDNVPEKEYEEGKVTNFYNYNGMVINDFKYVPHKDAAGNVKNYTVTMTAYNSLSLYGAVTTYDADGTLEDFAIIDKLGTMPSGFIDSLEELVHETGDIFYLFGNDSYYSGESITQESTISVEVPAGGYLVISNNTSSGLPALANLVGLTLETTSSVVDFGTGVGDLADETKQKIIMNVINDVVVDKATETLLNSATQEFKDPNWTIENYGEGIQAYMDQLTKVGINFMEALSNEVLSVTGVAGITESVLLEFIPISGNIINFLYDTLGVMDQIVAWTAFMNSAKTFSDGIFIYSPSPFGDNNYSVSNGVRVTTSAEDRDAQVHAYLVVNDNEVSIPDNALPEEIYQVGTYEVYNISMYKDGVETQPNREVSVQIPLSDEMKLVDPEHIQVYHLNDDGSVHNMNATVTDGYAVFSTDSFSYYILASDQMGTRPFTDVTKGDWFYDAVQYVYDKGMMNGVDGGRFAPNATTSRAMIVTILYRLENEPAVSGKSPFTDVAAGQWYTNAVAWAAANGIVTGTTDTTFAPNGNITREQMAAILYRYASYKGLDVSRQADLSGYADANAISAYAKQAMAWANGQGLITGVTATTLRPDGNAVRAQAATILMRLCEQVL